MHENPVLLSWAETKACRVFVAGGCSGPIMNDFVHWPFFGCVAILLVYVFLAIKFVRQYEGPGRPRGSNPRPYMGVFTIADLDATELWKSCWNVVQPRWLFGFRLSVFCYFFALILYDFHVEGFWMFYFFTQWTFTLLTTYFGVAAWVSAKHCFQLKDDETFRGFREEAIRLKSEDSTSGAVSGTKVESSKLRYPRDEITNPGLVGYVMQILFQVAGAAVVMTDFVYWLILVPYVLPPTFQHTFVSVVSLLIFIVRILFSDPSGIYKFLTAALSQLIDINMHCVNAVFLILEILLNNMYFPWFRTSYVVFWTASYVLFQWILHAIGFKTWPYPFLDLATPWAPAWYAGLSLFHVLLAIIVMVIVNLKQYLIVQRQLPLEGVTK